MSFVPEFHGRLTLDRLPDDFSERLAHRVETGLLVPGRRARAHYRVLSSTRDELTFGAQDFLTAYAIGLNRVTVRRAGANQLDYEGSFWRWTLYAVAHASTIGLLIVAVFLLVPMMQLQIAAYPHGRVFFWGMIGFFSLGWPWVLTAIHKRWARQALERILRETMATPSPEALAKQA